MNIGDRNISENLKAAVEARNLPDVRGALWSSLSFDRRMTGVFSERIDYVLTHGISAAELYEADDGASFDKDPTEAHFNCLVGLLETNFSSYKLGELKRMGHQLYTRKVQHVTAPEVPPQGGRDTAGAAQTDKCCPRTVIAVAFVVGIAVLGAAIYGLIRICR